MKNALQWIRSLLFNFQMYLSMAVLALAFLVPMILSSKGALLAAKCYCWWIVWTASWMLGLKVEVRGNVPNGEVLIAAKHQSFFDIIVIFSCLPRPKFIMKRQLLFAPILGQYAYRLGCIPVDRGKRAFAMKKMLSDVAVGKADAGQLVIYPQGTRVAPGQKKPYKMGSGALYKELRQDCVPVALNIGIFWPKRSILRKQGTAIVEFMDPIPKNKPVKEFMFLLESTIENRSKELMAEVGFNE